jgi:hypothetical protein
VPPAFLALTRQKYVVLLLSVGVARDVPVIVESLRIVVAKFETVESCTRYVLAPDEALQLSVVLVAMPVALLDGDESVGAEGGATIVVKEYELE